MIGMLEGGPVVLCDQCGLRVAEASDGNYYWAPGDESVSDGSAQTSVDGGFDLQAASSSRLWRASSYSTGVSLPSRRCRRRRL